MSEQRDLGPHPNCQRCRGTGECDNAQFVCPCRWSESPCRRDAEEAAREATPPAPEQGNLGWAINRLRAKAEEKRHSAGIYGKKLLRGHGYPDSVMHDAQDALALETVLDAFSEAVLLSAVPAPPAGETARERIAEELALWIQQGYTPTGETPLDDYGAEVLREVIIWLRSREGE